MTDRDIEMKLKAAVDHTAPDGLARLLSDVENGKGAVTMTKTNNKRRNRWIGLVAACLALVLIAGAGGMYYRQNVAVATVVSLDVNPSIELNVNRAEKVLSCRGLNEEGRDILASMNGGKDLEGAKLNVAVNAIVGSIVKAGYLDSLSSAILISVEDNDTQRGARLQAELVAEVDGVLQNAANQAGVLSQNMTVDKELARQAQQSNISAGKAALVNQVIALNGSLKFDELAALSVEELRDLIAIGAPGMPIGKGQAVLAASEYAGVLALDSVVPEVDPEIDDPVPHYEVELTWGDRHNQYEYTVDAFTGEVLSGLKDAVNVPAETPAPGLTAEEAFNAAADYFSEKHPELNGNFLNIKTEYDREDGHYDVEFWCVGNEFEYEVDGQTGAVLREDTDYRYTAPAAPDTATAPETPSTPAAPDTPSTPADTGAGVEAAKAAALKHAGLTADQVTFEKAKPDYDDGVLEYEIDFYTADTEYDYEISADGTVIKFETEPRPGTQTPGTGTQTPTTPSTPAQNDIGEDAAKAAGLARAGVTDAGSVTWIKCQREYDDGRLEYDLEFECGSTVHECEILAADGTVLSYESEPCDNALHHHDEEHHDDDHYGTGTGATDIGADAARTAALAHAGLTESQVTHLNCERDYDDGRIEYEVEFRANGFEYEYKIDASTGAVLEHEKDRD